MRSGLTKNAQSLRKNMTPEERTLWYQVLKTLPVPVKRQKVIGPYIVDFYIPSRQIVIEVDGSQHYEHAGQSKDILREEDFRQLGIKVLRYSNREIKTNLRGVYEDIARHCGIEG